MKRIMGWCAVGIGAVGFIVLLWQGPWWFDGAHLRETNLEPADGVVITGFRTTLMALGAGVVAGLGLYYTDRNLKHTRDLFEHTREKDRQEAELIREGQVTGQYVEAIKLLGSMNMTERLGGIYSLERIMRDSERDHAAVVAVLAALIRQHAPASDTEDGTNQATALRPQEDVQAALTVLGRRPERKESFRINLARTDLRGAIMSGANLTGINLSMSRLEQVNLYCTRLENANLTQAHFEGSILSGTQLMRANLSGAHLERTELSGANLEEAHAEGANFDGAILHHARLRGAFLMEAQLTTTKWLTVDQIATAFTTSSTALPSNIKQDESIQSRIAICDRIMRQAGMEGR